MNDRLSYKEKKSLPDNVFGLPERREYPMLTYTPQKLISVIVLMN